MEQFEYKVTVIVPIYNMETYLRDCLESLSNQTIDMNEMEVLLIDDGSPDRSIDIMEEFASRYPCMKILRKENEGLSMTRNYGIRQAKGKYIMYLDADDTITPETVQSVTDFFDEHYDEVDLVTYKEVPVIDGHRGREHFRYSALKKSGIYDLNLIENAFINQTRVNICVKNRFEKNRLFDISKEFRHEDQKYCTEVLREKMKIGYCNEGLYLYLHQPDSIVRTYFYAYYIFESTMAFWEELFAYYPDQVPNYIQALYMNDLSWKMVSNILLPYHYDEENLKKAEGRVLALLNRVSDEIILRHPGIDNFHRHYFISLKSGNDIKTLTGFGSIVVTNHDEVVFKASKIEIILCQFKVNRGIIKMMAFLKSALFNYVERPKLFLIRNRDTKGAQEIPLQESSWGYYRTKTKTNHFWLFQAEIDIEDLESFEFEPEVCGMRFKTSYYFMPEVFFSHKLKRYRYYQDGMEYFYANGVFRITPATPEMECRNLKKIRDLYRRTNKKVWAIRNICSHKIRRFENVWLYYDCKGVRKDNAYYQFVHDFGKDDGVRRYYVVNDGLDTVRDLFDREQRKYLVRFGSWFHKFLYLKARKVITAYIEKNNYMPFNDEWNSRYMDVSNQADLIYLQHGVLHSHQPWKYSLDRLCVTKEVISTGYERENLINHYCFQEENLIACGMPRYDYIDLDQESVNRILFAPSWRKYLISMDRNGWVTTENKFLQSSFFEETSRFLNSAQLHDLLERYDFYLDFKMHPIFERYKHLYHITNDRVTLAESTVAVTQYKVFMTDFSSFVFDFVYLKRPIIYFLPDDEMFRSGMNDYREIDIPFEKGFGDLALTAGEALASVQKVLENRCQPDKKYGDRMEHFFLYKDNQQCDRLYQALIED